MQSYQGRRHCRPVAPYPLDSDSCILVASADTGESSYCSNNSSHLEQKIFINQGTPREVSLFCLKELRHDILSCFLRQRKLPLKLKKTVK